MKKADKKRENQIRQVLTDACDQALDEYPGFQWLTHSVNYGTFPKSLKITCVFDTNQNLNSFKQKSLSTFNEAIKKALAAIDIPIQDMSRQIKYDTEENCEEMNGGNWGDRLAN